MHIGQHVTTVIDHQSGTITAIADQPDGIPLYRLRVEGEGAVGEPPRRRIVANIEIEADSWDHVRGDLNSLATEIATHGSLSRSSVMGGYGSSRVLTSSEDENITHDSYCEQIDSYVERLDQRKQALANGGYTEGWYQGRYLEGVE